MRLFLITSFVTLALIFFVHAPVVFAQSADGASCTTNADCLSNNCGGIGVSVCQSSNNNVGSGNVAPGGSVGSGTVSPGVPLINPLKGVDCSRGNGDCLSAFLLNILDFVIYIGSIVIILMIVFVGFKFVTAQGNDSKITEARQMLLWTVIGALVLLGSKAIALGIQATVQALGG